MASTTLSCDVCAAASPNATDDDDDRVYCPACVKRALQEAQERHAAAKQIWWNARQKCTDYYQQRPTDDAAHRLLEYPHRQQALRTELEQLRQQCSKVAMDTCLLQAQIVERQEQQQRSHEPLAHVRRQILSRIQQNLCGYNTAAATNDEDAIEDTKNSACATEVASSIPPLSSGGGALIDAIQQTKQHNRTLRFLWTIQAFELLRLHVDEDDLIHAAEKKPAASEKRKSKSVSGIGKISGLPLPHAGPELYGVLPSEELQSALRLVAQLTHLVARCLGIVLPHPILLQPLPLDHASQKNVRASILEQELLEEMDIANLALTTNSPSTTPLEWGGSPYPTTTDSMAPLASRSSARRGDAATSPLAPPLSMDPARVEQRIQHAVAPILAEDISRTTLYTLSTTDPDAFGLALALLQNDILVLCLRAGVPIPQLYPGEAILLNLYALKLYCVEQVSVQ